MIKYSDYEGNEDFQRIAESLIEVAKEKNVIIQENPEQTKHMLKTDLRDAIPPQLYAVIAQIGAAVESVSKTQEDHRETGEIYHTSMVKNKV
ncbi:EscU/YscU/HrcU family type III secretion system export apparatus switch protein [Fusibacter bizertensis]